MRDSGLLDSHPEEAFDRVTRLASRLLDVPVSLVTVVDDERQFFKSQVGVVEPWAARQGTPLSHSFCRHVVDRDVPLVVSDARLDPLVADNLAVDDLGVRAYLGVPLHASDDQPVGALCAINDQPRDWSDADLQVLQDLADSLHAELSVRALASRLERDGLDQQADHRRRDQISWARFERLADQSQDIIFLARDQPTFTFTYISAAAQTLTGYPPSAFLDDDLAARLIHPDDVDEFAAEVAGMPDHPVVYRSRHRDGRYRWLSLRIGRIADDEGTDSIIGVIRDVDETKRAALATRRALDRERAAAVRLRQLDEMKATFLTAVSHELRTPMTSILGYSALLVAEQQPSGGPDGAPGHADRIHRNALRLQQLLDDLTDVQQLTDPDQSAPTSPVSVDRIVTDTLESLDRARTP